MTDCMSPIPEMRSFFSEARADSPQRRKVSVREPLRWTTALSAELQDTVDMLFIDELHELDFSVTIADPSKEDCPLVACSTGFTELTGYTVEEIVGRNCRFLLNGVSKELVNEETKFRCRAMCASAGQRVDYDASDDFLPDGINGMKESGLHLPKGEMIAVQTNAKKSGELFRNMMYLRQVELDDSSYIIGMQAGLPEEYSDDYNEIIEQAYHRLEESMLKLEAILAAQFWYSATLHRQL